MYQIVPEPNLALYKHSMDGTCHVEQMVLVAMVSMRGQMQHDVHTYKPLAPPAVGMPLGPD